jgi:hypothetical protein
MVILQPVAHNVVKLGVKLQPQQSVTTHSWKSLAQQVTEATEQPPHEHDHGHDSSAYKPNSHDHGSTVSRQPSNMAILLPVPMPVLSSDGPCDPHAHNRMRTSQCSMSVIAAGSGFGSVREQVRA